MNLSLMQSKTLIFVFYTRTSKFIQIIHYTFFILFILFYPKSTKSGHLSYKLMNLCLDIDMKNLFFNFTYTVNIANHEFILIRRYRKFI